MPTTNVFEFRDPGRRSDPPLVVRATDPDTWTPSAGPVGFSERPLFSSPDGAIRTLLMKVQPGAYAPTHSHEDVEHVLILSGSFADEYGTYGPGDYLVRSPKAAHEASSENGALVLLVYTAP